MSYKFLKDIATADIAFIADGKDLPQLFISCMDATTNVLLENLEDLEFKETRKVSLAEDSLDMLLFKFLQEIVYYKDADQLLLRCKEIDIREENSRYFLTALLHGSVIDPLVHKLYIDVKAVTFHLFELKKINQGWQATVVLDI